MCEVVVDDSVYVGNSRRTGTSPFTVRGVGYSYVTDADVSAKAAKAKAKVAA